MINEEFNTDQPVEETPEKKRVMPWNSKFAEQDGAKNRQYSRSVRNQPAREATTMSKVLLFAIVCVLFSPFILYMWMSSQRGNEQITGRTASQVVISKQSENASNASSQSESKASASSESAQVQVTNNTNANASSTAANGSSSVVAANINVAERSSSRATNTTTTAPAEPATTTAPPATPVEEPTTPTGSGTYVIQPGDSWYAISVRYGIDVYELAAMNGVTIDSTILPGQTIIVP